MQDRFKFRAWDKYRKEFLSGGQILISIEPGKRPQDSFQYLDMLDKPDYYKDRFIIMQCTGLKDNTGKLIYEGDITENGFVVEYLQGNSGYYLMKKGEGFHLSHSMSVSNDYRLKHVKIIGNIYENPELLQEVSE